MFQTFLQIASKRYHAYGRTDISVDKNNKMTKTLAVRLITISTFVLQLIQTSCGEHICLPTILSVFAFLFVRTSFEIWGLAYLLGTFGQIYVIAKPDKNSSKIVYAICFVLLLFPIYNYYSYWQRYKSWMNSNIYWWFTIPFLILGVINLIILFKKSGTITSGNGLN